MDRILGKDKEEKVSKFLSWVLRHEPDAINLQLDENGWVSVQELIKKSNSHFVLTPNQIEQVVKNNKKQRFALSEDKKNIRANQGHSINVDLALEFVEPPEILYHGTATRFLESINVEGLKAMDRHAVHLSSNKNTAHDVGSRHGKVVILKVKAKEMHDAGHKFQCSKNGVWLTNTVPVQYLEQDDYGMIKKPM